MNAPLLSTGLVAVLAAAALFEPAASAAVQDSPRGFLGVFLDDLSITGTVPGSPAAGAGLQAGDRLLELDGMELDDAGELQSLLSERAPGREVRLLVMRDLQVTLGQRPEGEGGWLGVSLEEADGGVRLTEVQDGSPAEASGLRVADLVVAVNGDAVAGFDALAGAIGGRPPGTRVAMTLQRAFELKLAAAPSDSPVPDTPLPGLPGHPRILRVPEAPPAPPAPRAPAADGGGYLGVSLAGDGEVRIESVVEGSPAAAAGLRAGDQILAFDAGAVASIEDLASAIRAAGAGSEVVLDVLRDGGEEFERVGVTLGARPREAGGAERAELEHRMQVLQGEMRALSEEYGARMRDLGAEMQDLGRALGYESLQLNLPFPMESGTPNRQEMDRWRVQADEARRQADMAREMAERARVEALEAMERERARAAEERAEAGVRANRERDAVRERSERLRDEVRELREELGELRRALAEREGAGR